MAKSDEIREKEEDMGLGTKVIQENRSRFVNPDGSFNVHRKGMFERGAFSPYHALLGTSWTRFFLYVLTLYALATFFFTGLYFLAGPHAFIEVMRSGSGDRFGQLLFYSTQAITTLGSNSLTPATVLPKIIFALEALTGILGFAVGAGLVFARLSNPATKIIFSNKAIIAPFKDETAFMFRIINGRSNELIKLSAALTVAFIEKNGKRGFHQLDLERSDVSVFPINWTVVRPINKESPIYGMGAEDLARVHAEFLITITATDQDLSKEVYVRHSYLYNEIVVGAKFKDILERTADGTVVVDPKRIHEIEKAELKTLSR